MPTNSLQELYDTKVQLILDAELQALHNTPQFMEHVQSDELRQALQMHIEQTRSQVEMLRPLVQSDQQMPCMSMRTLFEEAQQMVVQIQDPDARDAYVIAAAQAIEHHEIAAYGTARSWAEQLGRSEDVQVLEEILN